MQIKNLANWAEKNKHCPFTHKIIFVHVNCSTMPVERYSSCRGKKHKILNLDDAEDGNLLNTSDEDKTTDEEEKAHSITAIWNFEKQNYYLKNEKR